ncbi:citrate synthase, partial [Tulasnella sp. 427]
MLDFDYSCGRETPSVAAMIYPFGGHHIQKFYWGTKETLLPVYTSVKEAVEKHPEADVVVNFASSRSVYSSTLEIMTFPQIKAIALIAEGVPERHAREILHLARSKNVLIIGPATVGGIKPGCFRIGNSGGMMDNIIASKLYRPGSVGYVSKSGGMSNELNNILSLVTNGTYEGIAIGGDRYPGSTFIDHLLRYEQDPECKMLVLLGEVGGVEEYRVIDAVKKGIIKKPIVAWAIGTCAKMFATEVQFGHAGSMANSDLETADAKNAAMKAAGFVVPDTFEDLPTVLRETYDSLVSQGTIKPAAERDPPVIPMDYKWAQELGIIRKPAAFISTISDERGQELMYAGMPISEVFKEQIGIGGVVSLLWFKRRLPPWATKFIEMVLMLTADHGPAVSGAMNTIVTSRAGKDLISSICSGLLTIGSRFGGALDEAASMFSSARDRGLSPREFVDEARRANKLISGIGHKIKSVNNPDFRVELVKKFVQENFPTHTLLDYALAVEKVTTAKKDTLILNVDGCIAVCFVDLLRDSGAFTREEADEYINIGALNGLFVLGRSIGFIGHHLDQKRLRAPLYRHPGITMSEVIVEDTYLISHFCSYRGRAEGMADTNRYLTMADDGTVNGHSPVDSPQQEWVVKKKPECPSNLALYSVQNVSSGLYLGHGSSSASGTPAKGQGTTCYWLFVHDGMSYRLQTPDGAASVGIANCTNPPEDVPVGLAGDGVGPSEARRWSFIPGPRVYPIVGGNYVIRCRATNTVVDNADHYSNIGNRIIGWGAHGGKNQKWTFKIKPGTDLYEIYSFENGIALGKAASNLAPATAVSLQRSPLIFQVRKVDIEYYRLSVVVDGKNTNYVLDVSGSNPQNGTL